MSQKETLVARAIVAHEVAQMRERRASTPLPRVTTDRIVEKYGPWWDRLLGQQNVRKGLNAAFRRGELVKLRDLDSGRKLREERCVVFTTSGIGALRLRGENLRAIWHDE